MLTAFNKLVFSELVSESEKSSESYCKFLSFIANKSPICARVMLTLVSSFWSRDFVVTRVTIMVGLGWF